MLSTTKPDVSAIHFGVDLGTPPKKGLHTIKMWSSSSNQQDFARSNKHQIRISTRRITKTDDVDRFWSGEKSNGDTPLRFNTEFPISVEINVWEVPVRLQGPSPSATLKMCHSCCWLDPHLGASS